MTSGKRVRVVGKKPSTDCEERDDDEFRTHVRCEHTHRDREREREKRQRRDQHVLVVQVVGKEGLHHPDDLQGQKHGRCAAEGAQQMLHELCESRRGCRAKKELGQKESKKKKIGKQSEGAGDHASSLSFLSRRALMVPKADLDIRPSRRLYSLHCHS